MIVVSNTTPLIGLAIIQRFELLQQLFGEIHILQMDEKKGRRKLTQLGLNKIGTVGILLKAKQTGLLPAIAPDIEKLCRDGFSLSYSVIDAVLQQAGE
ncbi:MAG: DUF3368 domain-containing protein [Anaerolineae bacterium]|nr:DUF3368 domain-containing protein [Anaerolineae bacterium]